MTNVTSSNRATIAAVIITKNEEGSLKDCLESLKWVDEIVIVDSGSVDKTESIAKQYTDKFYVNITFRNWVQLIGCLYRLNQQSYKTCLCEIPYTR